MGIGAVLQVKQTDESAGIAFILTGPGVTYLKAVKQLMRNAKGRTTKRQRWQSYRRSLGDDNFDRLDYIGIDDYQY